MNNRAKHRVVKNAIYKMAGQLFMSYTYAKNGTKPTVTATIKQLGDHYRQLGDICSFGKMTKDDAKMVFELEKYIVELGITEKELMEMLFESNEKKKSFLESLSFNNLGMKRDNKRSHNRGSRNSNANKVRLPRKNRSKATWERFYKLFPSFRPEKKEQN